MRACSAILLALLAAFAGGGPAASQTPAQQVPILAYHYVKEPTPEYPDSEAEVVVRPQNFDRQMAVLSDLGYQTVSLLQLWQALDSGRELPPRAIVITFDDCCERRHLEVSVPILKNHGFSATYFVVVGWIGKSDMYASWAEVAALAGGGMELGSHSVHHPNLVSLEEAAMRAEIGESKRTLEARTGASIRFFAYPFGMYDPWIQMAIEERGYVGAVTTRPGFVHSRAQALALPRLVISGRHDLESFRRLLVSPFTARPPG